MPETDPSKPDPDVYDVVPNPPTRIQPGGEKILMAGVLIFVVFVISANAFNRYSCWAGRHQRDARYWHEGPRGWVYDSSHAADYRYDSNTCRWVHR